MRKPTIDELYNLKSDIVCICDRCWMIYCFIFNNTEDAVLLKEIQEIWTENMYK